MRDRAVQGQQFNISKQKKTIQKNQKIFRKQLRLNLAMQKNQLDLSELKIWEKKFQNILIQNLWQSFQIGIKLDLKEQNIYQLSYKTAKAFNLQSSIYRKYFLSFIITTVLSLNQLGDEGVINVGNGVSVLNRLNQLTLYLSRNNVTTKSSLYLIDQLIKCSKLRYLKLSLSGNGNAIRQLNQKIYQRLIKNLKYLVVKIIYF
ncbi:hypothetical protein TTHERM_000161789 (macronuclear) [Tetrahymena thermophila SB210]|uniref:Uncharacterized protein n=1 Tax=Tetrahymena thermophila (strain SB210) TaxID=312017 RepID=W7X972_TETTS|nr:hypothetical protein TTHERM_000161789 [Tetrahymena thermophila SB210]EWS75945.1 hypothetical protein TTHERM_000161789 [Tetrahymena thermophila SB210]|eukprot:XP_012651463.1 hypothetical protein TTHERM_000161789 [Tetrahymena thermophila SB210]